MSNSKIDAPLLMGARTHESRLNEKGQTELAECWPSVEGRGRLLGSGLILEILTQNNDRLAAVFQVHYELDEQGNVVGNVRYAAGYNLPSDQIGIEALPSAMELDHGPAKSSRFVIGRQANIYCTNFGVDEEGRLQIPINPSSKHVSGKQAICEFRTFGGPQHAQLEVTNLSNRGTIVRASWPDIWALRKF